MKEIVLDTETTGISVKDGHRIVEIGCIELENLVPTQNKFHCYLNPERKVSEKALEVHGYTDEFLATQKKFLEVVEKFLDFIKNKRLIIHNADFDLSHLNNELAILGKKKLDNEILLKHAFVVLFWIVLFSSKIGRICQRFIGQPIRTSQCNCYQ